MDADITGDELVVLLNAFVVEWRSATTGGSTAADARSHSQRLLHMARHNTLRDVEGLTAPVFETALTVLRASVLSRSATTAPLHTADATAYELCMALLSLPECYDCRDAWEHMLDGQFIQGVLKQLFLASQAALAAQEKAVDAMGAVGAATAADADQPSRGSIATLHPTSTSDRSMAYSTSSTLTANMRDILSKRAAAASALTTGPHRGPASATLDEVTALRALLYWAYFHCASVRGAVDAGVRTFLTRFCEAPVRDAATAVKALLSVCLPVHLALAQRTSKDPAYSDTARREFDQWLNVLLPLHSVPGTISESMALLGIFHEPLVQCILVTVRSEPARARQVMQAIVAAWPEAAEGNTTKAVLLVHEAEQVLVLAAASTGDSGIAAGCLDVLLPVMREPIDNDNSRLVQVCLGMFKHAVVQSWLHHVDAASGRATRFEALLPSLYRQGVKHWNATVNKLTYNILNKAMETLPQSVVAAACGAIVSSPSAADALDTATPLASVKVSRSTPAVTGDWAVRPAPVPRMPARGGGQPPVTVTGVAPWAAGRTAAAAAVTNPQHPKQWTPGSSIPPPSTITGVAPWATPAQPAMPRTAPSEPVSTAGHAHAPSSREALLEYLRVLQETTKPVDASAALALYGAVPDATEAPRDVLAGSPTLLPSLEFHDLVFGRELGTGTFSIVRYAKHIRRGLPGSAWPEYAVKIMSTEVLRELGYELAARREIVVLTRLQHPNIARLVSAFRWRDGAYLVVEYANKGDLHSTLVSLGSMDGDSVRFLAAETAAAIHHIHQNGFVYGDCKPENILLVDAAERGMHVKLTDFGASRPFTEAATALVAEATHIIQRMRDGSWRARYGVGTSAADAELARVPHAETKVSESMTTPTDVPVQDADERLQGTEEYLAPEVLQGAAPSVASDAYAFGVTVYQCLAGRLPDIDAIWPALQHEDGAPSRVRFADSAAAFPTGFPEPAQDLVRQLLHPDPEKRLGGRSFLDILEHAFFAPLGDAAKRMTLHHQVGPKIEVGSAPPPVDPAWSRRHNSTMWAPLPKSYALPTAEAGGSGPIREVVGRGSSVKPSNVTWRYLLGVRDLPAPP